MRTSRMRSQRLGGVSGVAVIINKKKGVQTNERTNERILTRPLHYILQVFNVSPEDGRGGNRGSDTVKAKSSGEDPRATSGLVSILSH